jgi:hypothetical protein
MRVHVQGVGAAAGAVVGQHGEAARVIRTRRIAWALLLLIGALQAWAARFYITPDGISYLDLSDAVSTGHWAELLNAYWSPLYPFLIGLLRLAIPSAYWEIAVVHLLNLALFAVSIASFEYFVGGLRMASARSGKAWLDTPWGLAGAYAVFGVLSVMMTPLSLPTPDLLVSSACYAVFGALFRLHFGEGVRQAAVMLGGALLVGSLAKSFIVPWAVVTLIVALIAARDQRRAALLAAVIWLAGVLPWSVALSAKTGHPTFGDTGRLTYAWYVNELQSPSSKVMPSGTSTPATDSILAGVAVTPSATGTNPVWYDPARWYANLKPHFDTSKQVKVFSYLVSTYAASLGPMFLVLVFWLVVIGGDERKRWWHTTWVILIPCFAAIGAYSMVLVTTRYVAPFYVALSLIVLACANWPRTLNPVAVVIGLGIPLLVMTTTPAPAAGVALVNAAAWSGLFVWLARSRTLPVQIVFALIGTFAVRFLVPDSRLSYVLVAALATVLAYWLAARRAAAARLSEEFSRTIKYSLLVANCALMVIVSAIKTGQGLGQVQLSAGEPNNSWFIAQQARQLGITAGDRIALVGTPFEAYWARTARAQIVAVVPPPAIAGFMALPEAKRLRLYAEFAKAGASKIVVQQAAPPGGQDGSWALQQYVGWVKPLR